MRSNWKKAALSMIIVGLQVFSATVQAETLKGKLVELSSVENRITLQLEGVAPEKSIVSYHVSGDARWHICLKDSCIVRKGIEGFSTVNEYAEYGAYGIPHRTYDVAVDLKGNVATALEVQIVPKVH